MTTKTITWRPISEKPADTERFIAVMAFFSPGSETGEGDAVLLAEELFEWNGWEWHGEITDADPPPSTRWWCPESELVAGLLPAS
jgi:hypothetical protein